MFVETLLRFAGLLFTVPLDLVFGRRRKRYHRHVVVDAPRDVVWKIMQAGHSVLDDGLMPLEIDQRVSDDADVTIGQLRYEDGTTVTVATRRLDERTGEMLVYEILEEGTDPIAYRGDDYIVTLVLRDAEDDRTRVDVVHELTHRDFGGRFALPLGMSFVCDRIRRLAEKAAGVEPQKQGAPVSAALLTGVLTLGSFALLFDIGFAAILVFILLLHELGHVIAMMAVGLPVRGIYFVPFMGAVAVSRQGFVDEARRGFVALMGPAGSMLTTILFLMLAEGDPQSIWFNLALVSAMLNAFNLLPILPLDGGQVFGVLLSRLDPELRRLIQFALIAAAIAAAATYEMYVTVTLLSLFGFGLMISGAKDAKLEPIGAGPGFWLLLGYVATMGFYVAVIMSLIGAAGPQLAVQPS